MYVFVYIYIYIYIYIYTYVSAPDFMLTANLRTKILDFRGFASSIILILRGGIPMSIGNYPENLSQGILAGIILAGRLGV